MSTVLATNTYRGQVAQRFSDDVAEIAFGTGATPPSPDDTALEVELLRKPVDGAQVAGVVVTVTGTLLGAEAGVAAITEVGVFLADGTLAGRRTMTPKQLEPESRLPVSLDFQH